MSFLDHAHQAFYEQAVAAEQAENEPSRKALFYTLGLAQENQMHIDDLYDFHHHLIRTDGLAKAWQTETSRSVCRLAFNLFNGFHGRYYSQPIDYTPWKIFQNTALLPYLLQAVKLRFDNSDPLPF